MSIDRAESAVETAIAQHIAASFHSTNRNGRAEAPGTHIRNRIIDSFEPGQLRTEQDNQPPALVGFYRRIIAAFSHKEAAVLLHEDRSSQLADLGGAIKSLRRAQPAAPRSHLLDYAKTRLLNERQQLLMKNEFTEGFGRIEIWVLSIASLVLVLLQTVSLLWALPLLALSVCRSWHLDRQCKRRLKKIAEIDALIERIELMPYRTAALNAP
jgi:hypothetical protein